MQIKLHLLLLLLLLFEKNPHRHCAGFSMRGKRRRDWD